MSTNEQKFLPFYERIASCLPGYVASRVLLSALLGFAFLTLHHVIGRPVLIASLLADWSWFLALLISVAMLCLYYATYTLGNLCAEFDTRTSLDEQGRLQMHAERYAFRFQIHSVRHLFWAFELYRRILAWIALRRNFRTDDHSHRLFYRGIRWRHGSLGIYGVTRALNAFSINARRTFDFTSPDGCGGTGLVGDSLIVFSSVFLIVGVMISIYMLKTQWSHQDTSFVNPVKIFWIVFPYICSLLALFGPALPIARELRLYKIEQQIALHKRLNEIRAALETQTGAAERKDLREDHDFVQNRRKDLHGMRTWPFGLGANLKYLTIFAANVSVHVSGNAAKSVADFFRRFV
ncbi:MAG: hypothetical protein QOF24_167 [Verrucomicrobiota bacterium]|jgi:hypothetical protein